MADVVTQYGRSFVQVEIQESFIKKYRLEGFVNTLYYTNYSNFDGSGSFKYRITFSQFLDTDAELLGHYLLKVGSVLGKAVTEQQIDHILFILGTYNRHNERISLSKTQGSNIKENGKLLLELLKLPLPNISVENIYDYYKDEHYNLDEATEELVAYIQLESGLDRNLIIDANYNIQWDSVEDAVKGRVLNRLKVDKNISISMTASTSKEVYASNPLILSRDIEIKFHSLASMPIPSKRATNILLNRRILKSVVQNLFDEQKEYNTSFYKALVKHDFIVGEDISPLSKSLGFYEVDKNHSDVITIIANQIGKYLHDESIVPSTRKGNFSKDQFDTIFQLFLYSGFILSGKELPFFDNRNQLDHLFEEFNRKLGQEPHFFHRTYLKDTFKKAHKRLHNRMGEWVL